MEYDRGPPRGASGLHNGKTTEFLSSKIEYTSHIKYPH
jgi:hypothetical protein